MLLSIGQSALSTFLTVAFVPIGHSSWLISHSDQSVVQVNCIFTCFFSIIFAMTDYSKLTTEVLRLLCQEKRLPITGPKQTLINRLRGNRDKDKTSESTKGKTRGKRPATPPATRSKRSKDDSGSSQTEHPPPVLSINDDSHDNEQPNDGDSTRSREPMPFSVEQITSIVSAIVESKLASMSPVPTPTSQANAANINLGDPNEVQRLLNNQSPPTGDIAAHVDGKTRTAILQGEYVDFVSLLHENSTASSNISELLSLTVNGESVPIHLPSQGRRKKVPIDSFDRWLSAFSVFATILLSSFPHRAVEMFAYLNIIQSAHKKFLGLSWLAYDIDFRRRAARDPTLSWNKIHPQLYLEKFTGLSRSACFTCGGVDHMSHSCPLSPPRDRTGSQPSDPCRNFNRGTACIRTPCPYPHRCSVPHCEESHPATLHPTHRHGKSSKEDNQKRR